MRILAGFGVVIVLLSKWFLENPQAYSNRAVDQRQCTVHTSLDVSESEDVEYSTAQRGKSNLNLQLSVTRFTHK